MTITPSFKSAALAGIAGALLLGGSALGQAFTFSVESVALDAPGGVSEVYETLTGEALDYCEGLEPVIAAGPPAVAACHRDVVDTVVERIGERALTDYHARAQGEQTGESSIASL